MAKETFIIRTDWAESIFEMTSEGQATILRNLFRYHINTEDEMELDTQEVRIVWKMIRKNLDLNMENYEKRRNINKENGSKGGRPKANESENNPIGFSGLQKKAKETLFVTDTVIVSDTVIETDTDLKKDNTRNFHSENSEQIFYDGDGNQIDSPQTTQAKKNEPPRTKKLVQTSEASERFIKWYLDTFDTKGIKWTDSALNKAKQSFDKSVKRLKEMEGNDGLSDDSIHKQLAAIIKWIKADDFWSGVMISPSKLMDKDKNGLLWLDIFVQKYRSKSPELKQQATIDEVGRNVAEWIKGKEERERLNKEKIY